MKKAVKVFDAQHFLREDPMTPPSPNIETKSTPLRVTKQRHMPGDDVVCTACVFGTF